MPHTRLNPNAIPTTSLQDALSYISARVTSQDFTRFFSLVDDIELIPDVVLRYNTQHDGDNGDNGDTGGILFKAIPGKGGDVDGDNRDTGDTGDIGVGSDSRKR